MPADPTAKVDPGERLETKATDIGRLAPDFGDRVHFNSLVVRPRYRISLRLGSVDELCRFEPKTDLGRMERLQLIGYFYFPLRHSHAQNPFGTVGRAFTGDAANNVVGAWGYFKTRVLTSASDGQADDEIQKRLGTWIVDGGTLPAAEEDASKRKAADHFRKIRLPGGYRIQRQDPTNQFLRDAHGDAAKNNWQIGTKTFDVETVFRNENPPLGKIPLIALVEKHEPESDTWRPEKDATVYFQLQDAYDLPAFDPGTGCNAQLNRPPLRNTTVAPVAGGVAPPHGPDHYESVEVAAHAQPADDPQRGNAPKARGGKQGDPVAGNVFLTTAYPGWNKVYEAVGGVAARGDGRKKFFATPEAAGGAHPNAVKAVTNDEGEAGVLFEPSRCGGDRYRIRAYVGDPTIAGPGHDGQGIQGVRVDTGTFVVWRNLRLSRYVQMPTTGPAAHLVADVGNPASITDANSYRVQANVRDAGGTDRTMGTIDYSATGNAGAFDGPVRQWARAFIEFEVDPGATSEGLGRTLTQAEWTQARTKASAEMATMMASTPNFNVDIQRLLWMDDATITSTNAICMLPMRTAAQYNNDVPNPAHRIQPPGGAHPGAPAPANNNSNFVRGLVEVGLQGFLRSIASDGYWPGLTVCTGAYGYTWQVTGPSNRFSGLADQYGGCYVWGASHTYPTAIAGPSPFYQFYGFTANGSHEMGHVLFRPHAPTDTTQPNGGNPGGQVANMHDPATGTDLNRSVCVMSYQQCEGQFCTHCLLGMRGWNIP